jgi:hypothetical protein
MARFMEQLKVVEMVGSIIRHPHLVVLIQVFSIEQVHTTGPAEPALAVAHLVLPGPLLCEGLSALDATLLPVLGQCRVQRGCRSPYQRVVARWVVHPGQVHLDGLPTAVRVGSSEDPNRGRLGP